ncbi:hypothetical protein QQZ08_010132 [Neonectria magnoliae]|uniref:Phosphoglycerate mutase-like protein n=1 Tax=Neonectria magnoliae TaxID=2732573 RepID=A0ABR1HIK3_9HYPO
MDKHEVLVVRHAPANSNVGSNTTGTDISDLTPSKFAQFLSEDKNKRLNLAHGDYIPDNLSEHGERMLKDFKALFAQCRNVDMIFCSPLTRSIRTAKELSQTGSIPIKCIQGLGENTNWIQDIPPVTEKVDGRRYAYSLTLKGGPDEDSGTIVGEAKVDLTVDWPDEEWEKWNDPKHRLDALTVTPDLDMIEEEDKILRQVLRSEIQEISKHKGGDVVRVAVITHGGKINTLLGQYHTLYKKGDSRCWTWASSTTCHNLDMARFQFRSATDDEAQLVELPMSDDYKEVFGSNYRHLGYQTYENPDGSLTNQKEGYRAFLECSAEEVRAMKSRQPTLFTGLMQWTGKRAFVEFSKKDGGEGDNTTCGKES